MSDEARDGLGRLPRDVADRLTELVRALADLPPIRRAGGTVEAATQPVQPVLRALAGYLELAVDPLTGLVEGQRQLAERMAAWAELQREFAENMAAWADLQGQFADALAAVLGPLADSGRRISSTLDQVSGTKAANEGADPPHRS
jgi:ABC-type transporter Mla subunit MlaD